MSAKIPVSIITLISFLVFLCCTNKVEDRFKVEEISPWCILGFDSLDRTPEQRISMLKEMGFTKYGYNKGKGDLTTMKEEFQLAKENDVEITSIFLWLNAKRDSLGKLSPANQEILRNLKEIEHKPTIWLSFSDNFYKELNQEESLELSTKMVAYVLSEANLIGCKLAIYNHHGWFGNPYNQIQILEKLNEPSLSMVYNFHHAHEYIDEFSEIAKLVKPYLSYVNLNGVKKDGPQIMDLGKGDSEIEMVKALLKEGYTGPWGILGHIKTEDVQKVLERNVAGLAVLNAECTP